MVAMVVGVAAEVAVAAMVAPTAVVVAVGVGVALAVCVAAAVADTLGLGAADCVAVAGLGSAGGFAAVRLEAPDRAAFAWPPEWEWLGELRRWGRAVYPLRAK